MAIKSAMHSPIHLHKRQEGEDKLVERLAGTYRIEGRHKKLLHGNLHIKIISCSNLRNLDCNCVLAPSCLTPNDVSDPFVTVHAREHRLAKTSLRYNSLNPVWKEDFYVPVAHHCQNLRFAVRDDDFKLYDQLIGETFLPVEDLIRFDSENNPLRVAIHKSVILDHKASHGSLEFFVDFVPAELLSHAPMEVPGVYFKQQTGSSVNLYVNADDTKQGLPEIRYGDVVDSEETAPKQGSVWEPPRLWRDIYDAICQAKHLIYITGWSIDVTQSLLRGPEKLAAIELAKYSPYIGELLKQKADEGVIVNLLVWDDATSNFAMPGMMGTHDEVARCFFKKTKVCFRLAPMAGDDRNNIQQKAGKFVMFTHHQKLVILDTPRTDNSSKRELLAFVGGIDLTNGRYDTHEHPLFRTLTTVHEGDCHNACFNVDGVKVGPREPWRDMHSSVRGPGTLDIVQNFTERWTCQASSEVERLVDLSNLGLADPPKYTGERAWCTQLFRSIDARTCSFDERKLSAFVNRDAEDIEGAYFESVQHRNTYLPTMSMRNFAANFTRNDSEFEREFTTRDASTFHFDRTLSSKKGRNVDRSAQAGLIYHIRRAEHSVYIESQYFLSSAHMWSSSSKTKCDNLIAAELTFKICQKIEANMPFAVYIVVPMWPEGLADSGSVQAILYFQTLTMEAMYSRIAAALKRKKELAKKSGQAVPDTSPRDYLNFYCLANRETKDGDTSTAAPKRNTDEETLSRTRRHLIYVHSKMTIVDDAIALIGSANINQRSLDGTRDSEILLGSWQSEHLATKESVAHGDVHGYRLHCWVSIMGRMEDVFRDPGSIECVRRVNEIAEESWSIFCNEQVNEMHSHLIPYPVSVSEDGSIKPRTVRGYFLDTKGKITGTKSSVIPELLTT